MKCRDKGTRSGSKKSVYRNKYGKGDVLTVRKTDGRDELLQAE